MKTPGATKIEVVKVVRRITGLGLTETKRLIEAGDTIKGHMARSEAEDGIRDQPRSRGLGDVYKRQSSLEGWDLSNVLLWLHQWG